MTTPDTDILGLALYLEEQAHAAGWQQPPGMYALHGDPAVHESCRGVVLPLPAEFWHRAGSPADMLVYGTAQLMSPDNLTSLRTRLDTDLCGMAFIYEGWLIPSTENLPADFSTHPDSREARVVKAVTGDSVITSVVRFRHDDDVMSIQMPYAQYTAADPFALTARIPSALHQLVTALTTRTPEQVAAAAAFNARLRAHTPEQKAAVLRAMESGDDAFVHQTLDDLDRAHTDGGTPA